MKVSKKKLLLGIAGVVVVTSGLSLFSGDDPEEQKVAPQGYDYSNNNKLMPILNAKSFNKSSRNLLFKMREDRSGKLIKASTGYKFVIDSLSVKNSILTSKPVIQYVEEGSTKPVKMQPKNLKTGISYEKKRNQSNFDRTVLDEVAFTILKDWLSSVNPKVLGEKFFGKDVIHSDIAFPFALLSTQRQILESYSLKSIVARSGYSPLLMKYNQIYVNFIVDSKEIPEEIITAFEADVNKNIVSIANSLAKGKKVKEEGLNESAVLALNFYIHEDLKLLFLVKDAFKANQPLKDNSKLSLRKKRIEAENRAKQMEKDTRRRSKRDTGSVKEIIRR